MSVRKKDNRLRKMNKRLKHLQTTNPEAARKLEGQIAGIKGQKS